MSRSKKSWLTGLAFFLFSVTLGLWLNDWFIKNSFSKLTLVPSHESSTEIDFPLPHHPILSEEPEETSSELSAPPQNTKPTPPIMRRQNKFAVSNEESLRFTKEDYMDEVAQDTKTTEEEPDFFETEYDMDYLKQQQALSDAQKNLKANMGKIVQAHDKIKGQMNLDLDFNKYKLNDHNTERFAIKLQFGDENENTKLKFNYREAPNFNSSQQNIPEPILPEVKKEASFIEVEKSKTSASPWNTFDSRY